MNRRRRSRTVRTRADPLVDALRRALDHDRVRDAPLDRTLAGRDASTLRGRAGLVCWPETTAEVEAVVRVVAAAGRTFVVRGSGTGLAGGAVAADDQVVICTTRMNRIVEVDPAGRWARVQPGVVNLDLSRAVAPHGLHFAPDPSSQQSCTVGGNVANNSGGPHCLAEGVTSSHVLGLEVVLADGTVTRFGHTEPDPAGYDLRGAFVGSEGMFGIATEITVRLTPSPPAVATLLADFVTVHDAAAAVSAVIAAGVVPGAIELMDQRAVEVVEAYVSAGYPTDAAAVLLIELEGLPDGVAHEQAAVEAVARRHGARSVRVAADDAEREALWRGRKTAFGAVARIAPDYYLHDTVVPRTRLAEVLDAVYDIADRHDLVVVNVFHAGDGNLHPLLVFDAAEPGVHDRVHAAGTEIIEVSLRVGGVLSGEHGIGLEKRDHMGLLFDDVALDLQERVRAAFDPARRANPAKVLPSGSSCRDIVDIHAGVWV